MPQVQRRLVRASLLGVAAALDFVAMPSALADQSAEKIEPIQIRYDADRSCPTYEEFVANVRRYTTNWRPAESSDAARSFRLVLIPDKSSTTKGKLELEGAHQTAFAREIVGPDCEAVTRALAIALAVMIDPRADLSGGATEPPSPPPPESQLSEREKEPEPKATAMTPPRKPRAERARKPMPTKTAAHIAIEASFGLTTAVVTGFLPSFGGAVELDPLARTADTPSRLPRWVRPAIAVGVRQSLPKEVEESGLTSEFLWTAGMIRLCPVRWSTLDDRLEIVPCFEANAGVLRADARGSRDTRTSVKPWFDLGGSVRLTWRVHGPWFVGGMVALVAPVTRYRFELSTEASVSQAPATGVAFGPCAGVRF